MKNIFHAQRTVLTILFTLILAACSSPETSPLIPTASATALPKSTATRIPPTETAQPTVTPTEMVPPYQDGMQLTKTTILDKDSNGTLILRDTKTGDVTYFVSPEQQWVAVPDQIDRSQVKTIMVLSDGRIVLADKNGQGMVLIDLADKSVVYANVGIFTIGLKTLKLENGSLIELTPTPTPALPDGQAYETVLGVEIVVNTNASLTGNELTINISQAAADELGIRTATMDPADVDMVYEGILKIPYRAFGKKNNEPVSIMGLRWDSRYGYVPTGGIITGIVKDTSVLLVDDDQYQAIKDSIDPKMKYIEYFETDNGINPKYRVLAWFDDQGILHVISRVIMGKDIGLGNVTQTADFNYYMPMNGIITRGMAIFNGQRMYVLDSRQMYADLGCIAAVNYCKDGKGSLLVINQSS